MSKPNLFDYATSELSQDAFICWLLAWADSKYVENVSMHQLGVLFLDSLFDKCPEVEKPLKYHSIRIQKQYKSIDILVIVNNKYVLLIEDKTGTKNHSGQLERYLKTVKQDFSDKDILPIYFKTHDQGNYKNIISKGYKLYLRKDFLNILQNDIDNHILQDYREYLQQIEDKVNSYTILPIDKWSTNAVKGFYMALQNALKDGNWDYVANPSGGLWGYWWHWCTIDNYKIYMQIDAMKHKNKMQFQLKFKLSSDSKDKIGVEIVRYWKKHILYKDEKFVISKPKVVRRGRWTTIGISDTFIADINGIVNMKKTIENLKNLEAILDKKIQNIDI